MVVSRKARLIIRITNKRVVAQFARSAPDGDKIIAAANSGQLSGYGWKGAKTNTSAAYLTGLLAGKKAKEAGLSEAILDMGLRTRSKGARVFAALKGAVDAGVNIPHDKEVLPKPERIGGEHVAVYAKELAQSSEAYQRQFSSYLKAKSRPEELPSMFNAALKAISGK